MDRPIIFSAPMVLALLDGRKTQTRRTIKPQPADGGTATVRFLHGDKLWVRETFATWMHSPNLPDGLGGVMSHDPDFLIYKATEPEWGHILHDRRVLLELNSNRTERSGNWVVRSSIHMPRWASRLTLEVTGAKVERLKEISMEDARAEGFGGLAVGETTWFRGVWESIHGPGAWEANPWVAALSFSVHKSNIDAVTKEARL